MAPCKVHPGEERVLSIDTSDPAGLDLTSNWQCSAGSLVNPQLNTVTWTAPSSSGPATVTITVSNGSASKTHVWYFDVGGTVVNVTENITSPITWASGNIYVINRQDIYVDSTLKIQPGAIIKFGMGKSLRVRDTGHIEAVGTVNDSIVFTSLRDDLHGGDTNQDQAYTNPASGDWSMIDLAQASGNQFTFCEFYYGGSSGQMLDLHLSTNTVVEDCTFAFSKEVALELSKVQSATVERNTFYGNKKPVLANVNLSFDDSNVFHNPLDEHQTNTYQGIFLDDQSTVITGAVTWGETEVPFVITENVSIPEIGRLTLQPGTMIKLDSKGFMVYGTLAAQGTVTNPIVFTSYKDDEHGGDSNGNGSSNAAAPGDWTCIYVAKDGCATFECCEVMYGGTQTHRLDGNAAVCDNSYSSGTAISKTIFSNNRRGLDLLSPESSITDCRFVDNHYPLRIGLHIVTDNTLEFLDNTFDAIYFDDKVSVPTSDSLEWLNTNVPYVLTANLYLKGNGLQLGPTGSTVKVWFGLKIELSEGAGCVNLSKAVFTSYRDPFGGDVGGVGSPAKGDWQGIYDHGTWLSGDNIRFAANP